MASRKTRAQLDAERLAELDKAQKRIDSGEVSVADIEQELNNPDDGVSAQDRENMYREIEARIAELQADPETTPQPAPPTPREPAATDQPDIEALRAELANLKRTVSHYEQELNPAQRRAQELEREVEELRRQISEKPSAPEGPVDYGLTDDEREFDTVISVARKIAEKESDKRFKDLMGKLDAIASKVGRFESATERAEVSARIADHRTQLSQALGGDNPDLLFSHPKIEEWSSKQSEEEVLALRNPIAYSPKFVASILARFKAEEMKGQVVKEPSHGDRAVPARTAPDVIERKDGAAPSGITFNPRTFQADVQALIASGRIDDANKLVALAEKAMR